MAVDILELNCSRRSLLIGPHVWDQWLSSLVSLLETGISISKNIQEEASHAEIKDCSADSFLIEYPYWTPPLKGKHGDNSSLQP